MPVDPQARTLAAEEESTARPIVGDRYELLGMLGAGGMGNVYKARDLELDEVVALKVLRPELVGAPGVLERFRREVKLARRVTHPNVARVFDIGELGGEKILTMELVDGEALSALLERERALPTATAIAIAIDICAGVAAAHAAGVVHRDLKPDNVLLARDGRVVVSDFGIARASAGEARTGGGIIGTPAYMAPEQVEGAPAVDERADVYAFGAMLYEMLTGERPWQGESVIAVAAARLLRPPPDPRVRRPELDAELAAITLRCMARDRAERYASMASIATELGAITGSSGAPQQEPSAAHVEAPRRGSDKRVAVLPFRNLGPPDQDYVADGLTEDLIDLLSVARGLRVHSRGVVMRYKGHDRDPREVGRELGVQVVIEGSVRKAPGAYRVTARVVSVAEGFQLWAKHFERPEAHLLVLNDEVARAVAEALTVELTAAHRGPAADAEALDLYLRARATYHRFSSGDIEGSIALFEQALARSPDDPRIIAGHVMSRSRNPRAPFSEAEALRAEAERALRIAPSLPDAHVALGVVRFHFGDEAGAVRPFRRALRLSPGCAEAHDFLGRLLTEADRDEGRRHLESAIALEPTFEFSRIALARHHALLGQADAAMAVIEGIGALAAQARFALWERDQARAAELLRSVVPGSDQPIARLVLALLELTALGKAPREDAFALPPGSKPRARAFGAQIRAEVACAEGDRAGAVAALELCDSLGCFDVSWIDRCPVLELVRPEPVFAAVRASLAARAARIVAEYFAPEDFEPR